MIAKNKARLVHDFNHAKYVIEGVYLWDVMNVICSTAKIERKKGIQVIRKLEKMGIFSISWHDRSGAKILSNVNFDQMKEKRCLE